MKVSLFNEAHSSTAKAFIFPGETFIHALASLPGTVFPGLCRVGGELEKGQEMRVT